jgi:hypothetical protein
MSNILFTAKNRFYIKTDNGTKEYDSQKITTYIENVKSIKSRNDWKTSGSGASFMGMNHKNYDDGETGAYINGVSVYGDGLVYSATLGAIGGLYKKTLGQNDVEGHVLASNLMQIYKTSVFEDNCATSIGNFMERHLAVFDLKTGKYQELTEGDVIEDYPWYSNDGKKIFFSSAGIAISSVGQHERIGPSSICCFNLETNEVEELFESNKFNYIMPKEDSAGHLHFIKRPYLNATNRGNILLDIIMFPIRIIKAILGLLNYFSIAFGGGALRSGRENSDIRAKQKSEKELFFEGNLIQAEREQKANKRRGEKFPGIIPHTWELIRIESNGSLTCLKKGVMDYTICKNGDIVYSNGAEIIRLTKDKKEHLIEKCRFAANLNEL